MRSSSQNTCKRLAGWPSKYVSFQDALHHFLTPKVFKEGHRAWQNPHYNCSWSLKAILEVLLLMTWDKGDSEAERFQTARAYYVSRHQHEKRPGQTSEGFQQALRRVPIPVFRALAAGLRTQLGSRWIDSLRLGGWLPIGCDGARLEGVRTAQLEARLGQAGKSDSAPTAYLSAMVLLPLGLPWSWRLDKGTASEHKHLTQLLPTLPKKSLVVADAGYVSYELYRSILQAGQAFLIRMSSRAYLLSEQKVPLEKFKEGWVYYWPQEAQRKRQKPVRVRLLRVRGKKGDVWLLTNLDRQTLSRRLAAQIYRWRWRNEGLFRTYKRTLHKMKLRYRTAALIFREAEGSLLALQLLMALATEASQQGMIVNASPRQILLHIRTAIIRGIATLGPRQLQAYLESVEDIHEQGPNRKSAKVRRPWPRRKEHKPPKAPHLRMLTDKQKYRLQTILRAA
jgi:DDE family transposase